jgi:hypothetical protein
MGSSIVSAHRQINLPLGSKLALDKTEQGVAETAVEKPLSYQRVDPQGFLQACRLAGARPRVQRFYSHECDCRHPEVNCSSLLRHRRAGHPSPSR